MYLAVFDWVLGVTGPIFSKNRVGLNEEAHVLFGRLSHLFKDVRPTQKELKYRSLTTRQRIFTNLRPRAFSSVLFSIMPS